MDYQDEKRKRAKKRVDELKGFYIHFAIYLVINTFILVNIYLHSDDFWQLGHFVTLIFWGLGVGFHAMHTFKVNPLFGKNWEERQIQKYIDKDKDEANKYM